MFQNFLQDIRYAIRGAIRGPGFTALAILTLTLGIGANTTMFSLFDAVLLRTLPVAEPEQLFLLNEVNPREQGPASLSLPGFQRFQKALPAGAQMVALTNAARFNLTSAGGGIELIQGQLVSGNYFQALGVRAAAGRLLREDDKDSPVAVLSYPAWTKRFGGDRGVVGSSLKLNGFALTIIGVTEPGFYGVSLGQSPDVWVPMLLQHEVRYASNVASHNGDTSKPWPPQENLYWLHALVRAAPPATQALVAASLDVAFEREQDSGERQIGLPRDRRLVLEPGERGFTSFRDRLATPLKLLSGMVLLVLVIACINIANLTLVRGTARQREFAVRLSLGSSHFRLLRQLLTESVVLSITGGLFGVLLVMWAMPVLPRLFGIPEVLRLDYRLLSFAAVVSLLTGLSFGLIPALQSARADLSSSLKAGGWGSRGPIRQRFANGLIAAQVALSFVLVTGAALLGRSMLHLLRVDLGFDREHVITVVVDPRSAAFTPQQLPALYERLLRRIRSTPGVRDATISLSSLAGGGEQGSGIHVPGYTPQGSERPRTRENFVEPGYFTLMGMRLLQGRDFDERDKAGSPAVAVVNEMFVRRYFAGRNPIGRKYGYSQGHSGFEIVGVIRDTRTVSPRQSSGPMAFRPLQQEMQYARSLEIRVDDDPRALTSQVRSVISSVVPELPVIEVATLAERVDRTLSQERLLVQLTSFFAVTALLLACIGVYGLVSYRVARRTAELGIRVALGARGEQVIWMVVRESLLLLAAGLIAGLVLSMAGTQYIGSLLFGLSSTDPVTLGLTALFMCVVALFSAWLPARRAARVDPVTALRQE